MVGEALDLELGPEQIPQLHQDTPALEHTRGHVTRDRPHAFLVSFILHRSLILIPLENNLKKIGATPVSVLKVVRNAGSNLFLVYHVIPLSTEDTSFSGLRPSLLEVSTDSPVGLSSVTFKTTDLFWSLTLTYLLLTHC